MSIRLSPPLWIKPLNASMSRSLVTACTFSSYCLFSKDFKMKSSMTGSRIDSGSD